MSSTKSGAVVHEESRETMGTSDMPSRVAEPQQWEQEPDEDYKLSFKTLAALIALALANSCAVITNTVRRCDHEMLRLLTFNASDKHHDPLPD